MGSQGLHVIKKITNFDNGNQATEHEVKESSFMACSQNFNPVIGGDLGYLF